VEETLFTDGCNTPDGTSFQLQSDATFVAGTTITAQVISEAEPWLWSPSCGCKMAVLTPVGLLSSTTVSSDRMSIRLSRTSTT